MAEDNPAPDFTDITGNVNYSEGKVRQIAIYVPVAFATSMAGTIQALLNALETDHKPLSAMINYDAVASDITIGSLDDLRSA
ncbi:MAG: hypothetical protein R2764_01535 [Bacteroidales bacterium]